MDTAERYYQITGKPEDTCIATDAFRYRARLWAKDHADAAIFSSWFLAFDVAYVSVLWHVTDNLAAPLMAWGLTMAVEYAAMYKRFLIVFKDEP